MITQAKSHYWDLVQKTLQLDDFTDQLERLERYPTDETEEYLRQIKIWNAATGACLSSTLFASLVSLVYACIWFTRETDLPKSLGFIDSQTFFYFLCTPLIFSVLVGLGGLLVLIGFLSNCVITTKLGLLINLIGVLFHVVESTALFIVLVKSLSLENQHYGYIPHILSVAYAITWFVIAGTLLTFQVRCLPLPRLPTISIHTSVLTLFSNQSSQDV